MVAYLDEPPFFMPVPDSTPTGCDIELTEMILASLGVERIDYELTSFGELIDGVRNGRWHLNTPMFITAERAELVRYSRPVWAAIDSFIVRTDDGRNFTSYEAIASDPTIRLAAVTAQIQLATALDAGTPATRIVEFSDQDAAARAVLEGHVDASVSTAPGNAAYLQRLDDERLRSVTDERANDRAGTALGAFTFAVDSHGLADAFDDQLAVTLGTDEHLSMMRTYGFDQASLRPALEAPTS